MLKWGSAVDPRANSQNLILDYLKVKGRTRSRSLGNVIQDSHLYCILTFLDNLLKKLCVRSHTAFVCDLTHRTSGPVSSVCVCGAKAEDGGREEGDGGDKS